MNYNTDGFNERNIYIHNSVDSAKLKNSKSVQYDNSQAKMNIESNKPDIHTQERNLSNSNAEIQGANTDNKLIRDITLNNMMRNNRLRNFK